MEPGNNKVELHICYHQDHSSTEQLSEITIVLQQSCGAGMLLVTQDVSCADLVDKLHYSCRKFEEICCWCGFLEPEARINDKSRVIYKFTCNEEELTEFTTRILVIISLTKITILWNSICTFLT